MNIILSNVRLVVLSLSILALAAITLGLYYVPQSARENKRGQELPAQYARPDAVTKDIRSSTQSLIRVVVTNDADRQTAAGFGRIVGDHGSFVTVSVDKGADLRRLSLENQSIESSINTPNGRFEPLGDDVQGTVKPGTDAARIEGGYYIVQFGTSPTSELLESLNTAGVEVLQYVPHQAYYVYGNADAIARAANHSRVRWVGRFMPEHRITPELDKQLSAELSKTPLPAMLSPLRMTGENRSVFDVAVFKRESIGAIADRLVSGFGGKVQGLIDLPNNYFNVIRVDLPLDRVKDVSSIEGVVTIDFWSKPQREDERAAHIVAGNYTSTTTISGPGYNPLTQFGVNGSNVTVSVVDDGVSIPGTGGFYITSGNTVNGPLRGGASAATGGHGHINASIIAGSSPFGNLDATGHNYGLGVAPSANIVNIPMLTTGYTGLEVDAYSDTVITPGPNGVNGSISNNSWGNLTNGNVYDAYTSTFDGFVRDASTGGGIDPILLVFSAGNSGPGANSLTRPKTAKNIIATGNSENLRTELSASANNIDDLNSSSSRGPAADARVKPDITAPGTVIAGSRAGNCSSVSSCFETNHAWSSGTSHAAPQIAGAAALFTNFWKNNNAGVNPSPALVKAAIINTAQEMNGVNTGAVVPNGAEGWGRINMKFMLNTGVGMKYVNQTTAFTDPGNNSVISGTVGDATKPVRVSLVWTDPPGAANANPALVNNLDLTVTVGANTYRGNVFSAGSSTTGGSADTINNVENVWLPAGTPAGTAFSITVSATAINGDGILGNADTTDQHFSLVAYNFVETTVKSRADFDGDGKSDLSVFRPSEGNWYVNRSTLGFSAIHWGIAGDALIPGDYDGDGKADHAIFRPSNDPAISDFYIINSNGFTLSGYAHGIVTDIAVPGDFDGDGKSDIVVWRPSTGTWWMWTSIAQTTTSAQFGANGDIPFGMDKDGDGKANLAIYRPSDNTYYMANATGVPSQNFTAAQWGSAGDIAVPADYDGDNKDDVAVFRPSNGVWYIVNSAGGNTFVQFGATGDVPSPGDYDGDGKDDPAVFRNGIWYLLRSTSGFGAASFGLTGDVPVPSEYF